MRYDTHARTAPLEVWVAGDIRWEVLQKYQASDFDTDARWLCQTFDPYHPEGELGDVFASTVLRQAVKVYPLEYNRHAPFGYINDLMPDGLN